MALKKFKPNTPGQRQLVIVDRSGLWKGKPVKTLAGHVDLSRPLSADATYLVPEPELGPEPEPAAQGSPPPPTW